MSQSRKWKVKGMHQCFFIPSMSKKAISYFDDVAGINIGERTPFWLFHMDGMEKEIRQTDQLFSFRRYGQRHMAGSMTRGIKSPNIRNNLMLVVDEFQFILNRWHISLEKSVEVLVGRSRFF